MTADQNSGWSERRRERGDERRCFLARARLDIGDFLSG
jgi:hypothetical protein